MTTQFLSTALFASLAAVATACTAVDSPDPLIGEWESDEVIGIERNSLEIDDDFEGEATIYFYWSDGYLYVADFKVEAEPKGDGEYELSMECEGNCGELDFRMDCELGPDGDELECEGSDLWSDYAFDWKLQ